MIQSRLWTSQLGKAIGEPVRLCGWLHHFRRLSSVSFLLLRDAHGLAQIVIEDPEQAAYLAQFYHETVLEVAGLVVANPQTPAGVEIQNPRITVITPASAPPPLDLFRPTLNAHLPTVLDLAPLALRHPRHAPCFRSARRLWQAFAPC